MKELPITIDTLKAAVKMFEEATPIGRLPDMWMPQFGWIVRDGKPGEGAEAFLKYAEERK